MKKVFLFLMVGLISGMVYSQRIPKASGLKHDKQNFPEVLIDTVYSSEFQVTDKAFKQLIFSDLNYLILGDDSPQKGVSYEYTKDNSSLKLSGYLGGYKKSFFTVDAEFKTEEGIYFINDNDRGGSQAKLTVNYFFLSDIFWNNKRSYNSLLKTNKSTGKEEVDEQRAGAYLSSQYAKIDYLTTVYIKYKNLSDLLSKANYPYSKTRKEKIESIVSKLESLGVIKDSLDYEFDFKNYQDKKYIVIKGEFKDSEDESKKEDIVVKIEKIKLDKVVNELKTMESEIDTINKHLINIELEENEEVWNSKNVFYFGLSPYYERQSKEFFTSEMNEDTLNYKFNTLRRDAYGMNINYNFFRQSRKGLFVRTFLRINMDIGRSTNYLDLKTANVFKTDSLGIGRNNEILNIVKERNAYTGELPFTYARKLGLFVDAYFWLSKNFGVFGKLGYNDFNFGDDLLDRKTVPFRTGIMLDISRVDKKGKLAVVQAFFDRTDITEAPNEDTEQLRFGLKIGIPVNIKEKL